MRPPTATSGISARGRRYGSSSVWRPGWCGSWTQPLPRTAASPTTSFEGENLAPDHMRGRRARSTGEAVLARRLDETATARAAAIAADLGFYQRGAFIVRPATERIAVSDDRKVEGSDRPEKVARNPMT